MIGNVLVLFFVYHKANECPNKNKYKENKDEKARVRRVVIPNPLPPQVVQGKVECHCCSVLLDSGADITVVESKLVNPKQYTKSHITVTGVHGESQSKEVAEVWVHVDDLSIQLKVAVVEN